MQAMLSGPSAFSEKETNEMRLSWCPSHVLRKVCLYFQYRARYTDSASAAEIPEFPVEPEIALEMLTAANFLQC